MSTFDAWGTSGSGTVGGGPPQGYPGYAGPYGQVPGQGARVAPTRREQRGRTLRVIGMVLFFLAALANALDEFGPDLAWKNPVDGVVTVLYTMGCLLAAFMLVPAKTRGLGAGLALGQALAESARLINEVSPSGFDQFNLVEKLSFTGSYVLTALGGLVVAVALLVERGSTGRAVRMTLPVLALGIPGTVLWTVGAVQTDYVTSYGGTPPQSFGCCGWSTGNGTEKASDILLVVAMLAALLLAALVTRPGLAKGLLAGVLVLLVSEVVDYVISIAMPASATYGIGGGTGQFSVSAQARSGLWFALVGLVLFVVAFSIQRGEGTPGPVPSMPPPPPYPPQVGWPQPARPAPQTPSAPQPTFQPPADPPPAPGPPL